MEKAKFIWSRVAFLGRKGLFDCICQIRLILGTVSLLVLKRVKMYERMRLWRSLEAFFVVGNPAAAGSI